MGKLRFVVVGSGYRSLFYVRIAQALPQRFELAAMVCRSREKAERMEREYGIRAVWSEEAGAALSPDFVVVAVNKAAICDVTACWAGMGFPVLCETPAALTMDNLIRLWELKNAGARIQAAEQYALMARHNARIRAVQMGYLGDPYNVNLSAAHDYHGISLIRRYLGLGTEDMAVCGRSYRFPVTETDSRLGPVTDGRVEQRDRVRADFCFESGKVGFYDFSGVQYHSFIRTTHVNVQGEKGELDGDVLRYVGADYLPVEARFEVTDGTAETALDRRLRRCNPERITLGGQVLYENPFPGSGLGEDETAMAVMMDRMEAYMAGGPEVYPLAEALEDAYGLILLNEALKEPGRIVRSGYRPWAGEE